jgi:hypothetical protein
MFFGKKKADVLVEVPPTREERKEAEGLRLKKYVAGLLETSSRFVSIYVGGDTFHGMTLQEKMQTALSVIGEHSSVVNVQPFVEHSSVHMSGSGRGNSEVYLLVTLKSKEG